MNTKTQAKIVSLLAMFLSLCAIVISLSGCSMLKPLWPGGVTAADAEWSGSKSMQAVPISGLLDPQAGAIISAATLLSGRQDPFGTLLPITPIGETMPRWVFCNTKLSQKCVLIPLNARVKFAGSSVSLPPALRVGLARLFPLLAENLSTELWIAKDISASDFDD